jgi:hypothetical protein
MITVAALYVQRGGAYYGLPGVDPWDEARDARLYAGPHPVVAHPPCARWCQLAPVNQARYGHRIGDDGGCFAAALASVRQWGGVLEHPAYSLAWPRFGLPEPTGVGVWTRGLFGAEWVSAVSQAAYGHPAEKMTWLLYTGSEPPRLRKDVPETQAQVSFGRRKSGGYWKTPLSKREASRTPPEFRDMLIGMARSARKDSGDS